MKRLRVWAVLALVTVLSTFLVWVPFWLRLPSFWGIRIPPDGMGTVFRNFDGPLYLVVSKTFYNFALGNRFEFPLANEYYSAHFPLYPLIIRVLGIGFSFPWAMLVVTLISSVLAAWIFYELALDWFDQKKAFWLTCLFLIFPARFLVVRSIGSPEPLFMFLMMTFVLGLMKKNYWMVGIAGILAVLTKSPGVLLIVGYGVYLILTRTVLVRPFKEYLTVALIPLALLGLFGFYKFRYGDFWTYFHSGNNIHLQFLPFRVFNFQQDWVGTHWLEDIIWVYTFGLIGLLRLIDKKKNEMVAFVGVYLLSIFFVSHRDISRYALPIMPFVLLSLGDVIEVKYLKWFIWVMFFPILLYSINFIANNTMPVSGWGPLL